jgi:hypothetical protein
MKGEKGGLDTAMRAGVGDKGTYRPTPWALKGGQG